MKINVNQKKRRRPSSTKYHMKLDFSEKLKLSANIKRVFLSLFSTNRIHGTYIPTMIFIKVYYNNDNNIIIYKYIYYVF